MSHIVGSVWNKLPQFSLDCNDCLRLCLVYMYIKDVQDILLVTVLLINPELCPFEDRQFLSHIEGSLWNKLPQFSVDCNECLHLCLEYMYI